MEHHGGRGHIWTGIFILAIGGLALVRSFGVPMPNWLFSWQMLLIAIGLFIGFRKGFREGGWFVPILIGGAFLANDYILNGELRRHIWPLILILIGLGLFLLDLHVTNNGLLTVGAIVALLADRGQPFARERKARQSTNQRQKIGVHQMLRHMHPPDAGPASPARMIGRRFPRWQRVGGLSGAITPRPWSLGITAMARRRMPRAVSWSSSQRTSASVWAVTSWIATISARCSGIEPDDASRQPSGDPDLARHLGAVDSRPMRHTPSRRIAPCR